MLKRVFPTLKAKSPLTSVLFVILCSTSFLAAQEKINFSGKYHLTSKKKASEEILTIDMSVTQNADSIEIETRNTDGTPIIRKFKLDGTEVINTLPAGVNQRGKATLNKKSLLLETFTPVDQRAYPSTLAEKWELSKDSLHLKVSVTARILTGSMSEEVPLTNAVYIRLADAPPTK